MRNPLRKLQTEAVAAIGSLLFLLGGGTIAYHFMEGWTWISSFYFCVVSLATVGYGDLTPTSDATRLFTAFYLLTGAAVAISALAIIGTRYINRRASHIEHYRERNHAGEPPAKEEKPQETGERPAA